MAFNPRKFKKILIANRGEIACRIIWTCKEMGIKTVAVHSDVDRDSLHVRFADEAACIGPAPSAQSYLNIPAIISTAEIFNVDAIHPGYGFLAESPYFAEICDACNIKFIGPRASIIRLMGDKIEARRAMNEAGLPIVPGSPTEVTSEEEGIKLAREIGYPVIVKASAGGGGRGMRIVRSEQELGKALETASTEAAAAFNDGSVYIERYLEQPRHIEIQVLADEFGECIHLGERECSIQRRHQKLVEEAPSAVLTPELRKQMGEAAVNVAKAAKYFGAGTVEFLLDEKLNFYFLEMNTRLQVEHPVTEMITGLDLVKEMIKIADGEKISFSQSDLKINGHAMEVRVYAEDPANNFLPDIGTLTTYKIPQGPGVRVDDGMEEGMEIPIYYDPMIAKLITHAASRTEAIDRMIRAIDDYAITGVQTTLPFCKFAMQHEAFRSGNFDTHFVKKYFSP